MADEPKFLPPPEPGTGTEPQAGQPSGDNTPQGVPQPGISEPAAPTPQAGTADADTEWRRRAQDWEKRSKANKTELDQLKATVDADRAERAKQAEAEQARNVALAKFLGLAPDEPPTPEQLQERLAASNSERDAERARARASAVELAVFRASATLGADGNALLDSRAFASTLTGLDPSAADFSDQVAERITAAMDQQPRYKLPQAAPAAPAAPPLTPPGAPAPPVPARSGGEHTAPGGNRQWTVADVQAASKRNPQEVVDAIDQGLLIDLGYAPTRKRR